MLKFEVVARVAAVLAIALLAIGFVLTRVPESDLAAKIRWDWPLIAAYTLLFLSVAMLHWMRGSKALAIALAACAIAAAAFDVAENLRALEDGHITTSAPKWFFYFAANVLTALLFVRARVFAGWVAALLLVIGGAIGMVLAFFLPESRTFVLRMAGVASGGLIFTIIAFLHNPRALLR